MFQGDVEAAAGDADICTDRSCRSAASAAVPTSIWGPLPSMFLLFFLTSIMSLSGKHTQTHTHFSVSSTSARHKVSPCSGVPTSGAFVDDLSDLRLFGRILAWFFGRRGGVRSLGLGPNLRVHLLVRVLLACRLELNNDGVSRGSFPPLPKKRSCRTLSVCGFSSDSRMKNMAEQRGGSNCIKHINSSVLPSGGSRARGPVGRKPAMAHSIICLV